MRKVKKYKGIIVLAVVLLAVGIGVAVFFSGIADGNAEAVSIKKQSTLRLSKMDLTKSISATGTLASAKSKSVSASVNAAQIQKVLVQIGDEVKKGDELVTFDRSSLKEELSEAKDSLAEVQDEAERSIASAKRQLASATETYSDSKAKLQKEVRKAKKEKEQAKKTVEALAQKLQSAKDMAEKQSLNEQLAKAKESYNQAKESYRQAVANQASTNKQNSSNVENARDSLETAEANKEKNIRSAKKQVEKAQENYDKCVVTAPINGTITSVSVEAGDVYSGGTMFTVEDMESFEVSTSVDEYDISSIEEGQRVVLLTEATDEDELEGEITFVAPSATVQGDSSNMDVGSSSSGYTVKIAVKSEDERLKPGMTAKCSIILEEAEDVYAVPYDAVKTREDGTKYITVVAGSKEGGQGMPQSGSKERQEDTEEAFGEAGEENGRPNDSEEEAGSVETEEIEVTTGMESDYYVEIAGDGLSEGLMVEIPTDEVEISSDDSAEDAFPGGIGGGMPDMGSMSAGSGGNRGNGGHGGAGGPGMR